MGAGGSRGWTWRQMSRESEMRRCAKLETEARERRRAREEQYRIFIERSAKEWDDYWRFFDGERDGNGP
jgi:hypothetical protein